MNEDEGATTGPAAIPLWERLDGIDAELTGLTGRLGRVESGIEEIRSDLDHFEARADEIVTQAQAGQGPAPEADPATGDPGTGTHESLDMRVLVPWVRDNFARIFQRKLPQTTAPHWCRQWWQHPEAIVRFEALRRYWLIAVSAPGEPMSHYLIHADHHLDYLMSAHGPFAGCTGGRHNPDSLSNYLGQDDPPEDFYLAVEQANPGPGLPVMP